MQASTLVPALVKPLAPEKAKMRVGGDARKDDIAKIKREVIVINGQIDTKMKEQRSSSAGVMFTGSTKLKAEISDLTKGKVSMLKKLKNLERKEKKSVADKRRSEDKLVNLKGYVEYSCAGTEDKEIDMLTYKPERR